MSMDDPRTLPAPEGRIQEAVAFARDLAYGALVAEDWPVGFVVNRDLDAAEVWFTDGPGADDVRLIEYIAAKWNDKPPSARLLEVLGYLAIHAVNSKESTTYALTPKALALLEAPAVPPSVFIAYRREPSSAFALLLEARLASNGTKAFIDRLIKGGEEWEDLIRTTITQKISHFICVLAPGTLASRNVQNEIHWAMASPIYTIPIWHGGFTGSEDELRGCDATVRDFVHKRNAIRVLEESALSYDNAVNELVSQLVMAPGRVS